MVRVSKLVDTQVNVMCISIVLYNGSYILIHSACGLACPPIISPQIDANVRTVLIPYR